MITYSLESPSTGPGRTGTLVCPHGSVQTPAFMPVGTYGTVKGLTPVQIKDTGSQIVLANAYHLALRPGTETIKQLGGLHGFMGWDRPILTDSGGYQLFSLSSHVKVDEEGATFRSPVDGAAIRLTPESVVRTEQELGVDIAMAFDAVTADPGDRRSANEASKRTLRWAARTKEAAREGSTTFFGIMQGGLFEDLRRENADALINLDFEGYAVGGLSVGEERGATMDAAAMSVAMLPKDKPRYMMGMGTPLDLVELSGMGYDMFDCVMPTRNARNGTFFTNQGSIAIRNAEHATSAEPIAADCDCYTCGSFSRGYLHHLNKRKEMLAGTLGSIHNLRFYQSLMERIRTALAADTYDAFAAGFKQRYQGADS